MLVQEQTLDRVEVVAALALFRQACEEAAEGQSLLTMPLDIGFVLGDIVLALNLSSGEQLAVLGPRLRSEFFKAIRY